MITENHFQHSPSKLFQSEHESFLEKLAREECKDMPCKDHPASARRLAWPDDDEERRVEERRCQLLLLDFSSDDDFSDSESEEDLSTEEDSEEEAGDEEVGSDLGVVDSDQEPDNESDGEDVSRNEEEPNHQIVHHEGIQPLSQTNLHLALATSPNNPANISIVNHNHQRMAQLLTSLANSEEEPLIRADIPWSAIIACGAPSAVQRNPNKNSEQPMQQPSLLRALYDHASDPRGARLLQGVVRMDPPLEAVEVLLNAFPLSCLDMEGFFTACQFAHPNTSRLQGMKRMHSCTEQTAASENDENGGDPELDDVGEVVPLVMRRTIRARRLDGVDWGMVAFLGDARINPSHAKLLLRSAPEALVDPKHGAFGVSPLDRMVSGFFIHGERNAWVEKLRLALRVAAYVRWERRRRRERAGGKAAAPAKIVLPEKFFRPNCRLLRRWKSNNAEDSSETGPFYPYHELIRRIIAPTYQGNKFGQHGFVQTLKACTQSDPNAFLRPDDEGNLPIHVALREECKTVLGVKGERRLIKYLLDLDKKMVLCPEGSRGGARRRLPLRMSVENAWPVHDLIVDAALASCGDAPTNDFGECKKNLAREFPCESSAGDHIASKAVLNRPLLHDVLDGRCHRRFGIHGARQLVKTVLSRVAQHRLRHRSAQGGGGGRVGRSPHRLVDATDADGSTALHVALENAWPVYDLLVRADPPCLEARDPTRHGFFPFQTAACAFRSGGPGGSEDADEAPPADAGPQKGANGRISVVSSAGLRSNKTTNVALAVEEGQLEASLMEMSMLFELIRESPLCVSWGMSVDNNNQSDSRQTSDDRERLKLAINGFSPSSPRRSIKRRRPFTSPDKRH